MVRIRLTIKANARKNEFGMDQDGRLWMRISAPPVEGKANLAICRFLAELFQIPQSTVRLQAGASGKIKTFELELEEAEYRQRLQAIVG